MVWRGAHVERTGAPLELVQTERAQYKLDGVGRTKSGGQPVLQALGIISYDDGGSSYNMRAFNDGRFLETAMNLSEDAKRVAWVLPSENSGPVR